METCSGSELIAPVRGNLHDSGSWGVGDRRCRDHGNRLSTGVELAEGREQWKIVQLVELAVRSMGALVLTAGYLVLVLLLSQGVLGIDLRLPSNII